MNIILLFILVLVIGVGLASNAALFSAALMVAAKASQQRRHVWPAAGLLTVITTIMIIAIIALLPYQTVRSGTDYDIAAMNLAIQGFGYSASIGIGALAASLASWCCPRVTSTHDSSFVPAHRLPEMTEYKTAA